MKEIKQQNGGLIAGSFLLIGFGVLLSGILTTALLRGEYADSLPVTIITLILIFAGFLLIRPGLETLFSKVTKQPEGSINFHLPFKTFTFRTSQIQELNIKFFYNFHYRPRWARANFIYFVDVKLSDGKNFLTYLPSGTYSDAEKYRQFFKEAKIPEVHNIGQAESVIQSLFQKKTLSLLLFGFYLGK